MTRLLVALACGLSSLMVLGAPAPKAATDMEFLFHRGRVPASALRVELTPEKAVLKEKRGLVLRLKVTNASGEAIKTSLAHEWHGGLWQETSLFASVASDGAKDARPFVPAYLAGEDPAAAQEVTIAAGKAVDLELRMDWPGTGSMPASRLISKPGRYTARFAVVFEADGKRQYAASAPAVVEYNPE